jgi:hypothetical protein
MFAGFRCVAEMSDEPRRWTISECGTIVSHDCDQRGCPKVGLREDRITDIDIEKVERYLARFLGDKFTAFDFSGNARDLLALVLGGGS